MSVNSLIKLLLFLYFLKIVSLIRFSRLGVTTRQHFIGLYSGLRTSFSHLFFSSLTSFIWHFMSAMFSCMSWIWRFLCCTSACDSVNWNSSCRIASSFSRNCKKSGAIWNFRVFRSFTLRHCYRNKIRTSLLWCEWVSWYVTNSFWKRRSWSSEFSN